MCLAIKEMMEDSLAEGMKQGMQRGMEQGMNTVITGIQKLITLGRSSEIQRFTEDEAYRMKVMEEFGLKYN